MLLVVFVTYNLTRRNTKVNMAFQMRMQIETVQPPAAIDNGLVVFDRIETDLGPVWVYKPRKQDLKCLGFFDPIDYEEEQTCVYLNDSFKIVHEYAQNVVAATLFMESFEPKSILMIGLGGGVIARTIQDIFPSARFDIVELNQQIVTIALNHFNLKPNINTRIITADGFEFVQKDETKTRYDLTIIDVDVLYDQDRYSVKQKQQIVRNSLQITKRPGGVMAVNWPHSPDYSKILQEVTNETISLISDFNRIIILKNSPKIRLDKDFLIERARALNFKKYGLNIDRLIDRIQIDNPDFIDSS